LRIWEIFLKKICRSHVALRLLLIWFSITCHGLGVLIAQICAISQVRRSLIAELNRLRWSTGGRPGAPCGGYTPTSAQPVRPKWGVEACDASARLTSLLRLALSRVRLNRAERRATVAIVVHRHVPTQSTTAPLATTTHPPLCLCLLHLPDSLAPAFELW